MSGEIKRIIYAALREKSGIRGCCGIDAIRNRYHRQYCGHDESDQSTAFAAFFAVPSEL